MPYLDDDVELVEGDRFAQPAAPVEERPAALDTLAAAARQSAFVGGLYDTLTDPSRRTFTPDDAYDPLDDLDGFEQFADRLMYAQSRDEAAFMKARIRSELADRDTVARAGGWGLAASLAFGVTDPLTIASMALPAGGATRLARIGTMALSGGIGATIDEVALSGVQVARTPQESVLNVGGSVVLSGLLGAAIARRIPADERKALESSLAAEWNPPPESTVGARAAGEIRTLEQETIAGPGEFIAKTLGRISPLNRLMTSPSLAARRVVQELVDVPYATRATEQGLASPQSVELATKSYDAMIANEVVGRERLFRAYRERVRAAGETPMRIREFNREVAAAMRRGDESMIPEVAQAARAARATIITPIKNQLVRTGLLPPDVQTVGAMSYLPRLYDVRKIKATLVEWEDTLRTWLVNQKVDKVEAETILQDATRSILGTTRGFIELDPNLVVKAGALKERTLAVPDELLEPWLVNDVETVLGRYVRSVAPQIQLVRTFGDLDMRGALQSVIDDYGVKMARATSSAEKAKLDARLKDDLDDLRGLRDRILGKYGLPADPDSVLVRGARLFRDYNYVRLLGSQMLSSVPDLAKVIGRHGLAKTSRAVAHFATNLEAWKLAREDARKWAAGLDWTLNTRGATLAEIGDAYAETGAEQLSQRFANGFSRLTLMATWNSSLKFLTTALEQDAVLRIAGRWAAGEALTKRETVRLAQLGIDQPMAARIHAMAQQYQEGDVLLRGRTSLWSDREAALRFERAMLRAADVIVQTNGKGDVPLMMAKEHWKTLLQFRSFGMASVNRLVIPTAQAVARGDLAMANGTLLLLTLGAATYVAKQTASDQPIDTDPSRLVVEALDQSGLTMYLADPYDIVAGAVNAPRLSRYSDRSPIETLGGPSVGTGLDLYGALRGITDGGLTRTDVHRLRKLAPGQNVFYWRRGVNALEQEAGDALELPER